MTASIASHQLPTPRNTFWTPTLTLRTADLSGSWQMLRLFLRRDRIVAPLWTALIGLMPAIQVASTAGIYTVNGHLDQSQLDRFAEATAGNPALVAMYGPVFSSALGSIGTWKAGVMYAMIAVAAILTVIRHTRVEEETGRAELIGSTQIGRAAGLSAALVLTAGACLLAGLLCVVSLAAADVPLAGAWAFGAALAGSGLAWAGVAAVAAQISTGARVARGTALGALGTAFAVRAVGDAGSGAVSWLSPLGWCLQIRPAAHERWWVLVPLVTLAVVGVTAAYSLLGSRDVGSGLVADRPGAPVAARWLDGPAGLAWRLQRATLLGWTVGLGLYGLMLGAAAHGIDGMIGDNKIVLDMLARYGGTQYLERTFIAYAIAMLAMAAAAYSISATLRLHDEEAKAHTETMLAGAVGRIRYALSHIGIALLGPSLALLVSATLIGVAYGSAVNDVAGQLPATLGGALVQLPAVWVFTGIAAAIYGLAPRFTPVAWGVFVTALVVFLVGSVDGLPDWTLNLVPFTHPSKLPGGTFSATPDVILFLVATCLLSVALIAFRRRDIR